jgi:hypothetical protein
MTIDMTLSFVKRSVVIDGLSVSLMQPAQAAECPGVPQVSPRQKKCYPKTGITPLCLAEKPAACGAGQNW